jgi:beta-aspartyl-peptidase (threonine type)
MANGPVILVHGGAGHIPDTGMDSHREGCQRAAEAAWTMLQEGAAALDAVQRAVEIMEDDPQFNAGTGAVLNSEGGVQLDASIMDGATLAAGAVAAVKKVRNPIRLARRVLEDDRHVLLVAEGAHDFARQNGFAMCTETDLITSEQQARWRHDYGTVGAVALDAQGRLAAATSTGGRRGALPGRVGDSALIGCGTYANGHAAASCTGIGEAIIRVGLARTAVDLANGVATEAAQQAIRMLATRTGMQAGLIMVTRLGAAAWHCNTPHMPVVMISPAGIRCDTGAQRDREATV